MMALTAGGSVLKILRFVGAKPMGGLASGIWLQLPAWRSWQLKMTRRAHFLHKVEKLTMFAGFGER